ncbi:MAG: hypothetical protein J6D54_05925 [Olsenella sp.]|nr:hypothetical protein [Olsenella sp.]
MASFFEEFSDRLPPGRLFEVLDWLFDDRRFSPSVWGRGERAKFTKRIKKLDGFGDMSFGYKSKKLVYPRLPSEQSHLKKTYAVFSKQLGSQGADFVRHIRNGIAHGHASLYTVGSNTFIEIRDYGRGGTPSAFIAMPAAFISDTLDIYRRIEQEVSSKGAEE